MQPIDFDQQFQEYAGRFVQRNRTKFRNPEQIETMMPDLFAKWCRTPKKWLEGKSPEQYFQGFTEPAALVELMRAYLAYDLTPPSLLLDRLVDLPGAEGAVLPLVEDGDPHMAILAIQLLIELDSRAAMATYLRMIVENERPAEVLDAAVEALQTMADAAAEPALAAMEAATQDAVRARLLDVLAACPKDERIFAWMLRMFQNTLSNRALYAAYLGDYGDLRALPALKAAMELPGLNYLDYIEIVHAIEALGEEVEQNRDFAGDPSYEALKNMGDDA